VIRFQSTQADIEGAGQFTFVMRGGAWVQSLIRDRVIGCDGTSAAALPGREPKPFINDRGRSPSRSLTPPNKQRTMFFICSMEANMLKVFVEEAAALISLTLFVGMIGVWAQVIPQL